MPIFTAISLIQTALNVVGSFKGNAQLATTTGYVQDAVSVIGALTPLVQGFASGKEVTETDIRNALAGMHTAIAEFESLIQMTK